jgi:hypothetical protein
MMSKLSELKEEALKVGLYVSTYSPGDGVTRYRFLTENVGYFAGSSNARLYTALGYKDAEGYLTAYTHGYWRGYGQSKSDI